MIFLLKLRNNGTDDYCKFYAKPSDLILSTSVFFKSFSSLNETLLIISVKKRKKVIVMTTMIMMQLQCNGDGDDGIYVIYVWLSFLQ